MDRSVQSLDTCGSAIQRKVKNKELQRQRKCTKKEAEAKAREAKEREAFVAYCASTTPCYFCKNSAAGGAPPGKVLCYHCEGQLKMWWANRWYFGSVHLKPDMRRRMEVDRMSEVQCDCVRCTGVLKRSDDGIWGVGDDKCSSDSYIVDFYEKLVVEE